MDYHENAYKRFLEVSPNTEFDYFVNALNHEVEHIRMVYKFEGNKITRKEAFEQATENMIRWYKGGTKAPLSTTAEGLLRFFMNNSKAVVFCILQAKMDAKTT